jgi:hypothetical protein
MNGQLRIFYCLIFMLFACGSVNYKKNPGRLIDDIASSLRQELVGKYAGKDKITIGVAGFTRQDLVTTGSKYRSVTPRLGIMIANALQNEMFIPDKFDLIERIRVDALLNELDFNQAGFTDSESLRALKLKGVNSIVLGSIQLRDKSFRFDARLVELETGRVLSVATKVVSYFAFLDQAYNDYPKARKACVAIVQARGGWQNTSCVIKNSNTMDWEAKGTWSMTNNGYSFGPEGLENNPSTHGDYRLIQANHGALLCRIGTTHNFKYTGKTSEKVTGAEGVIECRINDNDVSNNQGAITVTFESDG